MRKTMHLSESRLRNHVRRIVESVLNEGSVDQELYNRWLDIQDSLGSEEMLNAIWNYLDDRELSQIVGWLERDYVDN